MSVLSVGQGCGGELRLASSFSSPPMPYNQSATTQCDWVLRTSASYLFRLLFDRFDFSSSPGCDINYVEIYQSETADVNKKVGRFCGQVYKMFLGCFLQLLLLIHRFVQINDRQTSLQCWVAIDDPGSHSGQYRSRDSSTLNSIAELFATVLSCWKYMLLGHLVKLLLLCKAYLLHIWNGWCFLQDIPAALTSTSNAMLVRMYISSNNTGSGFKAHFMSDLNGTVLPLIYAPPVSFSLSRTTNNWQCWLVNFEEFCSIMHPPNTIMFDC